MVEAMGTPKGFKKTEVGIIPDDWLLVSYDEVFDFLTTATYSRSQLSENDTIKYVHYGDIHTKCVHFLDCDKIDLPSIKNELLKNYPLLKDGDLIVVDASEDYEGVGKSVEVKNLKNKKAISGLHTFLLRDKREAITNGFKGYIQPNCLVKKQMDTLATGMKVYGVSKTNLKLIKIPLPPTKAEQTVIAEALNDADALITGLEKLIAKKKAIKQGAMQELLKPKEGWEVKTIGEIAIVGRGRVISHKEISKSIEGKYPVYSSQTFNNGVMGYLDSYDFDGEYLTWTTDGVYAGKVYHRNGQFNCTNVCGTIKLKKDYAPFVAYLLDTITPDHVSRNLANPKLMNDPMKRIEIPLPNHEEQIHIAQILSDMDNEIEALEKKLDKYKMLKQGMMQNLLTGKIRLI